MPILNREIIMRSKDIGRNDGCEITPVLFGISAVHGINETLGVCVSLVGGVGWSVVEHGFVNWVGCFVGEDAGGEHGD